VDTFKLSADPHFEEKLINMVGLYLNLPARAVVFSFDEKTPPRDGPHPAESAHGGGSRGHDDS